jgi:ABC-type Fe3+ transport system permease subunit
MFVRGMRDATIPLMLYTVGNQTLSVTLWNLWVGEGRFALASSIAVPMMIITILLSFLVARKTLLTEGGT